MRVVFVFCAQQCPVLREKSADPSVGVWDQLHCFFFARGGQGREGGRRARALDRRRQARARLKRRQDPQAKKKQWSYSHTPTEVSAAVASAIKFFVCVSLRRWKRMGIVDKLMKFSRETQIEDARADTFYRTPQFVTTATTTGGTDVTFASPP